MLVTFRYLTSYLKKSIMSTRIEIASEMDCDAID